MRFAYADPPYPGTAHLYKSHPDYGGEVDHGVLVSRLREEFPDGWALSTASRSLKSLLAFCPGDVRVMAWCRPDPALNSHHLLSAWEPVIMSGGRIRSYREDRIYDYLIVPSCHGDITKRFIGGKPPGFCFWLFRCLGALPGDELVDLFPGSGAVTRAWQKYQSQMTLPFDNRGKQTKLVLENTQQEATP